MNKTNQKKESKNKTTTQKPKARVSKPSFWKWGLFFLLLTAVFFSIFWYFFLKPTQTQLTLNSGSLEIFPTKEVKSGKTKELSSSSLPDHDDKETTSEPSIYKTKEDVTRAFSSTDFIGPDSNKSSDVNEALSEIDKVRADTDGTKQPPVTNEVIEPKSETKTSIKNTETNTPSSGNLADDKITEKYKEATDSIDTEDTSNGPNTKTTVCRLPQAARMDKAKSPKLSFNKWLMGFKAEARFLGIDDDVLDIAFKGVRPIQKVIDLDRRQSEYTMTFSKYLSNSISSRRISTGKSMLKKYRTTLKNIEKEYGVQPQFLVAFWAMESNFGANMGNFPTISTLATLAHEGRRSDFFYGELLCALQVIQDGHIQAKDMKSSWAGAMGQPQFMPSTFFHYGADGNSDGKLNIWNNTADVFASSANYLKSVGWNAKEVWGMEIKLPKKFDPYLAKFSEVKSLSEWQTLGVKRANGKQLPIEQDLKGAIILPSGIKGPAFLILNNFKVIRQWNRSLSYALAIGHLSDRLIGKGALKAKGPKGERPLSRKQATILQSNLQKLGFYNDKVDGMVGIKTRDAIREYQKGKQIPADAYPSPSLIAHTQKDVKKAEEDIK